MKKALAFSIASICALGFAGGVFADPITSEGETPVDATYIVSPAYTITVPAGITFSSTNTSVNESVKAENVLINDGETLKVSMKSANGNLINGADSYIPYSYKLGEAAAVDIVADTDYELLSIESGNKPGEDKSLVFTAGGLDNVTLAGLHADTLTFKIEIKTLRFMQDLGSYFDELEVGQQLQIADRNDNNRLYWVAKMDASHVWMTQNIDYAGVSAGSTIAGQNVYYANGTAANGTSTSTLAENAIEWHYADGSYYDWTAAKSVCAHLNNTGENGWSTPTAAQYNSLISTITVNTGSPFYGVYTGYSPSQGNYYYTGQYGFFWSSSPNSRGASSLDMAAGDPAAVEGNYVTDGYPVRCVYTKVE